MTIHKSEEITKILEVVVSESRDLVSIYLYRYGIFSLDDEIDFGNILLKTAYIKRFVDYDGFCADTEPVLA